LLISIHGQHDNQILLNPDHNLQVLDEFGGNSDFLTAYQEAFRKVQSTARELKKLKLQKQQAEQKKLIFQKQIQEVAALNPQSGEEEELENALIQAEHAEKIRNHLADSSGILREECVVQMQNAIQYLHGIEDVYPDVQEILKRLQVCMIELQDISQDLRNQSEHVQVDEIRTEQLRNRYQAITQAKKQFFCDFDELIQIYDKACAEIDLLEENSGKIAELEAKKAGLLADLTEKANALSDYREQTGKKFAERVSEELQFLDMPNVILTVQQEKGKLTIQGRDSVLFLISANQGEAPRPISKIASGGELSRIMLALKSVIADRDQIPTLIFDEIDTGVSGRAAQKIGTKLREISRNRQVLCVTHLSQIAVMADTHYMIEKHDEHGRTVTQVHLLDFDGRVQEIARIMGGENPSKLMLENAREELKNFVT
ncbi:MAG: DNA repair protein RecN, partial [Oscillospiraceae bacterium]|nr:DNA repair protein RecN [Oscillospiraceae bacterium]